MYSTGNQVSLYKKLTMSLMEQVGISHNPTRISYYSGDDVVAIDIDENGEVININQYIELWSPVENELRINQTFQFDKPSLLYGLDGITMTGNKIGIAAHIHSKTSNFQETINFGTIPNDKQLFEIEFNQTFEKNTLRGTIEIDFFLFVKEIKFKQNGQASRVGMILSGESLLALEFVIDGIGSEFPMSEFNEKDGPLWKIEKNWVEAQYDSFTSDNINLSLNVAHPLFEQLKAGKTKISRAMMGDIMVQAMSLIVQQVILIEKNDDYENDDIVSDSILSSVNYWISTFDIDTTNLFSIINSMKKYWDKKMMDGEEHD